MSVQDIQDYSRITHVTVERFYTKSIMAMKRNVCLKLQKSY